MSGPYLYRFPRPELGAAMERTNLNTMHEEALVISILSSGPKSWSATLMTRNGIEFVSSDAELRGDFDWRPRGWVYERRANCFVPPGITWNEEEGKFEGEINEEALLHAGEPMEKPKPAALPQPRKGEKHSTWKSRVYRTMPELKDKDNAAAILAEAWESRSAAATV